MAADPSSVMIARWSGPMGHHRRLTRLNKLTLVRDEHAPRAWQAGAGDAP